MSVLLSTTEEQQQAISQAINELKRQNTRLDNAVPQLQKAVQVAIAQANKQPKNRAGRVI